MVTGMAIKNGVVSGAVSVQKKDGPAGTRSRQNDRNRARKKKKLNYNPRDISAQLVRAKKSGHASRVMTRARSKLSVLSRAYASGQYDEAEIRNALIHAKKMVECSRMKVRNLKEEEILDRRNEREHATGEMQKRNKVRRIVKKKEQDLKVKMALEENQRILKEKMQRQELMRRRKLHRGEEQGKILEADMDFLKEQMKQNQGNGASRYDGVELELSGAAAQLSEIEMIKQQIETEAEMQVEMEMVAMEAAAMTGVSTAVSQAQTSGADAAPAVSVDVAV